MEIKKGKKIVYLGNDDDVYNNKGDLVKIGEKDSEGYYKLKVIKNIITNKTVYQYHNWYGNKEFIEKNFKSYKNNKIRKLGVDN